MDFTGDSTQRKWEIKVSQFLCGATYAPQSGSGCLQYYTGLTGQITSFNFQVSSKITYEKLIVGAAALFSYFRLKTSIIHESVMHSNFVTEYSILPP